METTQDGVMVKELICSETDSDLEPFLREVRKLAYAIWILSERSVHSRLHISVQTNQGCDLPLRPRNITYPKKQEPEWSEYASYPNIVKRWQELDNKIKHTERVIRYWQVMAVAGWIVAFILLLVATQTIQ